MRFEHNITRNLERALQLEWLETNGLGGWASSTVCGAHTRRYHGLLVAATRPPRGRVVLLSKLEESLVVGDATYELGCNRFSAAVHPRGHEHLVRFEKDIFPTFEYEAGGVRLRKTIAAVHGENTTLVVYEILDGFGEFVLELRPFIAARGYHALTTANDAIGQELSFAGGVFHTRPYVNGPDLYIRFGEADFRHRPDWYYGFEYDRERERGLDFREDLWTPGVFRVRIGRGARLGIIVSVAPPGPEDAFDQLHDEHQRRLELLRRVPGRDETTRVLTLAADQFVVRRDGDGRTLIAGYPWFGDWGRDTMIALPGLCLATGRHDDAEKILRAFVANASQGMLPNRFPDGGEQPEYNTVDAALWFFVAVHQYLKRTGDRQFVNDELLPVLRDIVAWHDRGTRYGIHVAEDGLLCAGERGVQLTWMDAKVGDWVVTPRQGKAVEINALWYNALALLAEMEKEMGRAPEAARLGARARQVRHTFSEVFWNDGTGCLFDVIGEAARDDAIRPNQVIALSLPFCLLDRERGLQVLRIVEQKLLTPFGLRSLDPDHPSYNPHYIGDARRRDGAYHQGTVWTWLLGPYLSALMRLRGESGAVQARAVIEDLMSHLGEAGIGTVSEIFDGDPPHAPRGCIAQAWSVAELLRIWVELAERDPVARPSGSSNDIDSL